MEDLNEEGKGRIKYPENAQLEGIGPINASFLLTIGIWMCQKTTQQDDRPVLNRV